MNKYLFIDYGTIKYNWYLEKEKKKMTDSSASENKETQ